VAGRAARTARELAEKLHARLVLVHVVPPRPPVVLPAVPVGAHPGASAQLRELDEADAETAFASVADEAAGANAEQVTMHGYAADRLSALAHARGARLIVVGTRGRGPARSALLGSVSQELAAGSCRPVVIVPEAELPTPHGKLGPGRSSAASTARRRPKPLWASPRGSQTTCAQGSRSSQCVRTALKAASGAAPWSFRHRTTSSA
jgi:nucleotide-binding universal stress UspA family protein